MRRLARTVIALAALAAGAFSYVAAERGTPFAAAVEVPALSPQEAHAAAMAGDLLLVDVRPAEAWGAFGVPEGAETAEVHAPMFHDLVDVMTEGDRSMPIALIRVTGGRSRHAAEALPKRGYTRVHDVPEGGNGSAAGPGWTARGLPLETVRQGTAGRAPAIRVGLTPPRSGPACAARSRWRRGARGAGPPSGRSAG